MTPERLKEIRHLLENTTMASDGEGGPLGGLAVYRAAEDLLAHVDDLEKRLLAHDDLAVARDVLRRSALR